MLGTTEKETARFSGRALLDNLPAEKPKVVF